MVPISRGLDGAKWPYGASRSYDLISSPMKSEM